ncbi:unnamed protein product [Symbiodinium natans]|uniref:Uncharacterized protein n=1 Tax=Symbiodinium natans TaxID=878477 RepID=A0A812J7B2_9DINO|nr:unnamed protein product [Symbiodinium natans]CAE7589094.1 unnamed protein product [Symbiodinium natans]
MSADNGETVSMVLQYATVKSRIPRLFQPNFGLPLMGTDRPDKSRMERVKCCDRGSLIASLSTGSAKVSFHPPNHCRLQFTVLQTMMTDKGRQWLLSHRSSKHTIFVEEVLQIIMTLDLQQGADRKVQISMSLMSGQVISTVETEHSMRLYELRRALFQHVSAFSRLEKETMKFCTTSGRMVHLRGSATVHSLLVNPLKRPRAN